MNKNLPVYDIVINDETQGVAFISLVDTPAIGVDWIKLSTSEKTLNFKAVKDQQMLYGPFLIPNMLIYRFDEKMGEYYVRFSEEQISKIAEKFNEDLNNRNINFQHTNEKVSAFVASNWLVDGTDKSNNYGFDLPKGSWFGGVKVKDENFWNDKVKSEEVKGFSVEILADLELKLREYTKNKTDKMEKTIKLETAMLKDGISVYWDGDFVVGTTIYTDEAMTQLAPDADHVLEDGTIVTTKDGIVMMITPVAVDASLAELPVTEPTGSKPLSASEVSTMIDARFSDLMNEITLLKELIGQGQETMVDYKKQIEEKFSTTPISGSIKTTEVTPKMDDRFSKEYNKIIEFSKVK